MDLAYATADRLNVDIIIVMEPNKNKVSSNTWIKDIRNDVAVFCRNKNIGLSKHESCSGYVKLIFRDFDIYGAYISPNVGQHDFKQVIDGIMELVRNNKRQAIILGDLNAKSPLWNSKTKDKRGEYIEEWVATLDIVAMNGGNSPTFVRGESESYIDVTFSTQSLATKVHNWRVLEEESMSLHKYIAFDIETKSKKKEHTKSKIQFRKQIFVKEIKHLVKEANQKVDAQTVAQIIKKAQKAGSSQKTTYKNNGQPYWWSLDVEMQRNVCNSSRRKLTRARKRQPAQSIDRMEREHTENVRKYKKAINLAKKQSWNKMCDEVNDDIWGEGYRVVVKGIGRESSPYNLEETEKKEIVTTLFPKKYDLLIRDPIVTIDNPCDINEIVKAGQKLKVGKAPGPDGVLAEAIKATIETVPNFIVKIFNELLNKQTFPMAWKRAKVVLLPKPGISNTVKKFRAICLIDTIGKLFEIVIRDRLEEELTVKNVISERQYGFRRGRSTVDACKWVVRQTEDTPRKWCAMITIDVENAFNTIRWSHIIHELQKLNISKYLVNLIQSYLSTRELIITKKHSDYMTAGVPQGSVLGPTLWNIFYNSLLNVTDQSIVKTVAYADDLALLVMADDKDELIYRANEALYDITRWMEVRDLKIAVHKTEAIILKGPRKREDIIFNLGNVCIKHKKVIKYLGIWLDHNMLFANHVKETISKAEKKTATLSRIMPNIHGPRSEKRKILCYVIQSVILYGSAVWANVLQMQKYRDMVNACQRKYLLRIASAYRTTSAKAIQVVTGQIPLDLLVDERRRLYDRGNGHLMETKNAERTTTICLWETRWAETTEVAQWTKRLIPNVREWIECKHRSLEYFLAQFLTGHGSFGSYLKRIGKTENDICRYCDQADNPNHTAFECVRWSSERQSVYNDVQTTLTADNITDIMLSNVRSWKRIHNFIKDIMSKKESEERGIIVG